MIFLTRSSLIGFYFTSPVSTEDRLDFCFKTFVVLFLVLGSKSNESNDL